MKETPWWWESAEPAPNASASVDDDCDVVIVGAGFAGLSAGITLARNGKSVQIFDADDPGRGASSRNGGMASGNLSYSITAMVSKFGADKARAFYAEGREARDDLAAFLTTESIDCDFKMTGRFTGAMTDTHFENQQRECEALNEHIGIDAWIVNRESQQSEIGSELYRGGMVRPDIGGLHPGKLHRGILRVANESGARIHGNHAITNIQRNHGAYTVEAAGKTIKCANVIVATNGYTDSRMPWLQRRIVPIASQIIATEELDPELMNRLFPKKRMHGETRRLFHYYRPSPDGKRILFGGRAQGPLRKPEVLAENLRQRLVGVFPELYSVKLSHSWWGYVGYTFDALPHMTINDGVHYATGFCGSGVVWARWVAMKAAKDILGTQDRDTVFRTDSFPTRPLYTGKTWFLPAAIAWKNACDNFDLRRAG